jgi:hypothetical protein
MQPNLRTTLALLLLAALPHLPSLFDPLFADDYLHIERTADLRSGDLRRALQSWVLRADDAAAWWTPPDLAIQYLRPLVSASFLLDHSVSGLHPFGYHLTNLVLHLLATLVCWGLALRVLGSGLSAWAAAAMFGLHPAHTEAVSWVSGRTDLLVGLLYGASALCLLPDRIRRPPGPARLGLGTALFLAALLAKEMAVTLPVVVLLASLLLSCEARLVRRLAAPAVCAAVAGLYFAARWYLLGGLQPPPHPFAHSPGDPDFLPQMVLAPLLYLADLVLFVPPDPVVTAPFWLSHPVLLSVLAGVSLLALAGSIRAVQDRSTRLFALGWTALTLLPVLPVSVGERFLYLPSMGYCLLIGAKLPRVSQQLDRAARRGAASVALVVLLVALAKALVFSSLATHSRRAIDDALAEIDRDPSASLVLVADLPAASALAFPHALRLERPDRHLEVEVLSISSQFLGGSETPPARIEQPMPDRLLIRAAGDGYLGSYIERAYLGQRPFPRVGEQFDRPSLSVRVLEMEGPRLRAFEVRLLRPPREVLLLQGSGFGLRRASPA